MTEKTDKMKEVINALHGAILAEQEEKHSDWVLKTIETYGPNTLADPDKFNVLVNFSMNEMTDLLFQTMLHNNFIVDATNDINRSRLETIYLHFDFFERHLDDFICKQNGWVCSHDRLRYVIGTYIHFLQGKSVIWTERHFSVPSAGTSEQWIEFVDGLVDLFNAQDLGEKAQAAKKVLEEEYRNLKLSNEEGVNNG